MWHLQVVQADSPLVSWGLAGVHARHGDPIGVCFGVWQVWVVYAVCGVWVFSWPVGSVQNRVCVDLGQAAVNLGHGRAG